MYASLGSNIYYSQRVVDIPLNNKTHTLSTNYIFNICFEHRFSLIF